MFREQPDGTKMNILKLFLIFLAVISGLPVAAQPPPGYYDAAGVLTGKELQQALHDIIDGHTAITYSEIWGCFRSTDAKPDSSVWDIYSDVPGGTPPYSYTFTVNRCGTYSREGDCYNREHLFPKSWFGDADPMVTDLFHIFPTDGWVNNKRGNLPFGETSAPKWTSLNGSKVGPCSWPGYASDIFEPIDEYKGDLARTMMYMAVRYYNEDRNWPGSPMVTGAEPRPWARDMLLSWHWRDSVSLKEIQRNEAVFIIQKNRNPFIDDPLFAEKIWGSLNPLLEPYEEELMVVAYPNPAFEKVFLKIGGQETREARLTVFDITGITHLDTRTVGWETVIPLQKLSPGLYFLKVTVAGGTQTLSFVKAGQ